MNVTDVTGPCNAVQYGLIMLTCGSQTMEYRHDRKPVRRNAELQLAQFRYWKTNSEPSSGFLQTSRQRTLVNIVCVVYRWCRRRVARGTGVDERRRTHPYGSHSRQLQVPMQRHNVAGMPLVNMSMFGAPLFDPFG